jgi:hypothetical protein
MCHKASFVGVRPVIISEKKNDEYLFQFSLNIDVQQRDVPSGFPTDVYKR